MNFCCAGQHPDGQHERVFSFVLQVFNMPAMPEQLFSSWNGARQGSSLQRHCNLVAGGRLFLIFFILLGHNVCEVITMHLAWQTPSVGDPKP